MKEKKQLVVMTFFGPIPFGVVKEYLSKKSVDSTDSAKDKTLGNVESPVPVPMHVGYYIVNLAKKVGWRPEKMVGYLQSLWNINPCAAFSVLLREVAIELDKRYEDHINNCEEVFIISPMDGRIHKAHKAHIKNFRNFAAFRTEEDAKIACRILREDLKEMFKSGRE